MRYSGVRPLVILSVLLIAGVAIGFWYKQSSFNFSLTSKQSAQGSQPQQTASQQNAKTLGVKKILNPESGDVFILDAVLLDDATYDSRDGIIGTLVIDNDVSKTALRYIIPKGLDPVPFAELSGTKTLWASLPAKSVVPLMKKGSRVQLRLSPTSGSFLYVELNKLLEAQSPAKEAFIVIPDMLGIYK